MTIDSSDALISGRNIEELDAGKLTVEQFVSTIFPNKLIGKDLR